MPGAPFGAEGTAMTDASTSPQLLNLLNQALARELQVSIQYMLQHAVAAGRFADATGAALSPRLGKFVASDAMVYFPGWTLKKIAIAEMRHAEAIAERLTKLKEEPTTMPDAVILGATPTEMLELDREQERGAIALYEQIIDVSQQERDDVTLGLFQRILGDERKHHRVFAELLESEGSVRG